MNSVQLTTSGARMRLRALILALVCALLATRSIADQEKNQPGTADLDPMELFGFHSSEQAWSNIDDVVMGGVSSSRMRIEDGVAFFSGTLSLENNGGFASVRSKDIARDLTGYDGVRLRVKGDGKKYQFRIATESAFDGPSYQATFETKKDVWTEVELRFSDFIAAFRGRTLPNHPPIDAARIATMGLLISDKQEGDFRLVIDWVAVYKTDVEAKSSR